MIEVLNPTYDDSTGTFERASRLSELADITIGIISNGKRGTEPFFDALATELVNLSGVGRVERLVKPNYSAPAGSDVMDKTRHWHALIAGIGD